MSISSAQTPQRYAVTALDLALRPDFDAGGLLALMRSLAAARDLPVHGAMTPLLPAGDLRRARCVVFILIDGLGDDYLLAQAAPNLLRYRRGHLSSVFPSATASAVTTLFTGEAPGRHGITGWFTHIAAAGGIVRPLPLDRRGGGGAVQPAAVFATAPLFARDAVPQVLLNPAPIADSPYSRWHMPAARRVGYDSLATFFGRLAELARGDARFIHAYFPGLDSLAHEAGIGSAAAAELLAQIDAGFAWTIETLRGQDVAIVLSADHGFIDTTPERAIDLAAYPDIAACLAAPLSGEPRIAYCRLVEEKRTGFAAAVSEQLGHAFHLLDPDQLITAGWFGPPPFHSELRDRLGDAVLLARDNYVLHDWLATEKPYFHRGVHGGISRSEMFVPLIYVPPS